MCIVLEKNRFFLAILLFEESGEMIKIKYRLFLEKDVRWIVYTRRFTKSDYSRSASLENDYSKTKRLRSNRWEFLFSITGVRSLAREKIGIVSWFWSGELNGESDRIRSRNCKVSLLCQRSNNGRQALSTAISAEDKSWPIIVVE